MQTRPVAHLTCTTGLIFSQRLSASVSLIDAVTYTYIRVCVYTYNIYPYIYICTTPYIYTPLCRSRSRNAYRQCSKYAALQVIYCKRGLRSVWIAERTWKISLKVCRVSVSLSPSLFLSLSLPPYFFLSLSFSVCRDEFATGLSTLPKGWCSKSSWGTRLAYMYDMCDMTQVIFVKSICDRCCYMYLHTYTYVYVKCTPISIPHMHIYIIYTPI